MNLTKTLQAILDSTDLEDREKIIEATRFAASELILRDIENVSFSLGSYKVDLKVTDTRE